MAPTGISRAFHIYVRAFREVRPFWPWLALILTLGLASVPLSLLMPLPMKLVLDNVLGGKPLASFPARLVPAGIASDHSRLLVAAIGFSVVLGLISIAHKLVDWMLRETVADRMVHHFRGDLLLHGLKLPALHHTAHGTLDLGYRINLDAPALQWTAIYGVIPVLIALANIGCTLYVTAAISLPLALIALATSVPTLALVHLYQARLKAKWHAAKEQESAAQSLVHEVLSALRVVVLFGQERREQHRFLARSRLSIAARLRAIRTEGLLGALLSLSTVLGTAAILYLGVRDVQAQLLSIGDLLVIVTYVGQLYGPLQAIGTHVSGQQHAVASAERAFAILDCNLAIRERPDSRPLVHAQGKIEFRGVTFGYDAGKPTLSEASFVVPAGASVGITGRTGAGKTTLVNLLLRLFDPDAGEIRLDGVDLRDWRLADLRRQFAVVPQEPTLFSTSVAENIAYARPGAGMAAVVAAAQAANAHEFITALPQGYETPVGERGLRLSGGERQRIALARAFLADAPIIVLDEPTSAVDRGTETAIVESLERLRRGRTLFIIAHRLATLRHVDLRLRVDDGKVETDPETPILALRQVS
jgi:ATP-binding cassette, subfamily B, bacterial